MKAALSLSAALVGILLAQPLRAQGGPTVLDGVFTEAQAKRGETAYTARCAECHDGADVDGPALEGTPFLDRWREDSLEPLFSFLKTSMPADKPGDLSDATYVDVIAYILKTNTYPAGAKELTVAGLSTTRLVGKDGPQPLPTNALVQVTGCLTHNADGSWTLTKSGELSRTMVADRITPQEQTSASARPAGAKTFMLRNLGDLSGFPAEAHANKKVLTKGVLVHEGAGDRINVTAASDLGASCGP